MTTPSTDLLSRYADLLEPVSADAPCGPDLEYDQAFVLLQAAIAPKTDAQYGDFVDSSQPVNWAEVERDCRALLARSRTPPATTPPSPPGSRRERSTTAASCRST